MLYKNAKNIKPIKGYQDIVCHGDKIGLVYTDSNGNKSNISVTEFVDHLKDSNLLTGEPLRLIVCESGAKDGIVAQKISELLNVDVIAPIDIIKVYPDGELKIVNNGKWVKFKPKRGNNG